MKRLFVLVLLAGCFSVAAMSQNLQLMRKANGTDIGAAPMEVTTSKRITLIVDDAMPGNAGYVYEFGAVNVYRIVNGQRVFVRKFRDSEVMNGPVVNFSFGPQRDPDLIGDMEFEIEWIKRYNPNNTVDLLPFSATDRTMRFNVHL